MRMVPTEKGKLMPLNPEPAGSSAGTAREGPSTIALVEGRAHVLRPDEPWDGPLYVSHFATCPEARRWSRHGKLRQAADAAIERVRKSAQ